MGSRMSLAAPWTTRSRMAGTVVSNRTSHNRRLGSRLHVHRRPHALTAGLFNVGGKGHIQASAEIPARLQLGLFNPIVDRTFAGTETGRYVGDSQLPRGKSRGCRDLMRETYPAYGRDVEGPSRASPESGGIELGHQVFVALVAQSPDEVDRARRRAATHRCRERATDDDVFTRPRAPPDADAH